MLLVLQQIPPACTAPGEEVLSVPVLGDALGPVQPLVET